MKTDWIQTIRTAANDERWPTQEKLIAAIREVHARIERDVLLDVLGISHETKLVGSRTAVCGVMRLTLTTEVFRTTEGSWRHYVCQTWQPGDDPSALLAEGRINRGMMQALHDFSVFAPRGALLNILDGVDWEEIYVPSTKEVGWDKFCRKYGF